MEIDVAFHKWHVVAGPVGGTVTSVDGSKTFCTIPEGGQGTFYATVTKVVTSDASITVDEVENFNCAPVKLRLLGLLGGGTSTLPSSYLAAEFIEFTGNTVIRISIPVNNSLGLYFDYEKTLPIATNDFPISWQRDTPYRAFRLVCGETSGGFNWWETSLAYKTPAGYRMLWQANFKNNRTISVNSAEYGYAEKSLLDIDCNYDEVAFGRLWLLDNKLLGDRAYFKSYSIKLSSGSKVVNDLIPAIAPTGEPCMYDKVSRKTFCNSGTGQFIVGMTLEQAQQLGNLPAGGGSLTVSLPWEAQLVQYNAEVEAALEVARSKGWLMKVQYREPDPDSVIYNKYAACTTTAEVKAVNANYKTDLTADGVWIYPLEKLKSGNGLLKVSAIKGFSVTELPNLEEAVQMFSEVILDSFNVDMPRLLNMNGMFVTGKLNSFSGNIDKVTEAGGTFNGTGLKHFSSGLPSLRTSGNMFTDCKLDKPSVLLIAETIKTFSAGLTIGIDASLQNDEEVLEAIALIQEKRGSVTVQWNGTSPVSTYGLRRMPVYAAMIDGVNGKEFEWGHYVTNWEENGYREFASVEEAREYFNIEETQQ